MSRLLVFNLATDADDPVLGFTTVWLNRLAAYYDAIDVIAMRMGRLDVAEADGVVCGFVAFQRNSLNWLYVDPDRYRQGVGRALLRHAIGLSGPVISTQALAGNEPAIALYRSEGFVEIERRRGRLAGSDEFPAVGVILELRR